MFKNQGLVLKVIRFISVIVPLSLIIFAHEREIIPLYGSGPTSYLLDKIVFAATIASAIRPIRISLSRNFLYNALALTLAPDATYWLAVWTSRRKDPLFGPAITHIFALGPLVFLLTIFVAGMEDMDVTVSVQCSFAVRGSLVEWTHTQPQGDAVGSSNRSRIILSFIRASATYLFAFSLKKHVWAPSPLLYHVSDSYIVSRLIFLPLPHYLTGFLQFLALAGIFFNLWIASPAHLTQAPNDTSHKRTRSKKKKSVSEHQVKAVNIFAFNALWWAIYPRFTNPILPHPLPQVYTHPTYPFRVLSAEQSVTGLITVVEWLPPPGYQGENDHQLHSARYMRASHSLLGGVWIHDKVQVLNDEQPLTDLAGEPLGDSIYSTFVQQEAVRLVNSTKTGKAGAWRNALVM